jgi:hypothetical protein
VFVHDLTAAVDLAQLKGQAQPVHNALAILSRAAKPVNTAGERAFVFHALRSPSFFGYPRERKPALKPPRRSSMTRRSGQ